MGEAYLHGHKGLTKYQARPCDYPQGTDVTEYTNIPWWIMGLYFDCALGMSMSMIWVLWWTPTHHGFTFAHKNGGWWIVPKNPWNWGWTSFAHKQEPFLSPWSNNKCICGTWHKKTIKVIQLPMFKLNKIQLLLQHYLLVFMWCTWNLQKKIQHT